MHDAFAKSDLRVIVGGHATLCGSSRQSSDAIRLTTLAFGDSGEHSVRAPGAVLPGAAHRGGKACRVAESPGTRKRTPGRVAGIFEPGSAHDDLDERIGRHRLSAIASDDRAGRRRGYGAR